MSDPNSNFRYQIGTAIACYNEGNDKPIFGSITKRYVATYSGIKYGILWCDEQEEMIYDEDQIEDYVKVLNYSTKE